MCCGCCEAIGISIYIDAVARLQFIAKDHFSYHGLDILLDIPLQRTCTINRIITMICDVILCSRCQLKCQFLCLKTLIQTTDQDINDTADVVLRSRLEHNDLIKTVQKFRSEMCFQIIHRVLSCFITDIAFAVNALQQIGRTNV